MWILNYCVWGACGMGCGLLCFAVGGDREGQEAHRVAWLCWEVGKRLRLAETTTPGFWTTKPLRDETSPRIKMM